MSTLRAIYNHFIKPEFKFIAGDFYKNLLIVALIFLLSLITIGLGNGVTEYLREKMEDPFIRFVDLKIPYSEKGFKWESLKKDTLQQRFHYGSIEPVYFRYMYFKTNNGEKISGKARRITTSSEFYDHLSGNKEFFNTPTVLNKFSDDNYHVIITKGFLNNLGYSLDHKPPFIRYEINIGKERHIIPLPLSGVVNKLPHYTDMLISKKLDNAIRYQDKSLGLQSDEHQNYLRFYLDTSQAMVNDLKQNGYQVLSGSEVPFGEGVLLEKNGVENIEKEVNELESTIGSNFTRVYDFDRSFKENKDYSLKEDLVTLPFKKGKLDSISAFNEYLTNHSKYNLRLDMNTIESKQNFQLFNNISRILSFSLIIFSILVVILFVINVILSHIEKNKKNLGTLKAFGLPNISIVLIYTFIAGSMVFIAFAIALGISYLIGNPIIDSLVGYIGLNVGKDQIGFAMYTLWIIVLFFIIMPGIVLYIRLHRTLSRQTPGDLVYERV